MRDRNAPRHRLGRRVKRRALGALVLLGALGLRGARDARADLPFGDGVVAEDPPWSAPLRVLVARDVERAVRWLRSQAGPGGRYGKSAPDTGDMPTALACAALLHAGVAPSDPGLARALPRLRSSPAASVGEAAARCMAIRALRDPTGDPFSPFPTAQEGVEEPPLPGGLLAKEEEEILADAVGFLLRAQLRANDQRVPGEGPGDVGATWIGKGLWAGSGSLSVPVGDARFGHDPEWIPAPSLEATAFALLGLRCAERCGYAVPDGPWIAAARGVGATLAPKGPRVSLPIDEVRGRVRSSGILPARDRGLRAYGRSETTDLACAASALVLAQHRLGGIAGLGEADRKSLRDDLRDALAALSARLPPVAASKTSGIAQMPRGVMALEAISTAGRIRTLGGRELWREACESVHLDLEAEAESDRDVARTAWFVLVLRRATVRPVRPVLSGLRADPR